MFTKDSNSNQHSSLELQLEELIFLTAIQQVGVKSFTKVLKISLAKKPTSRSRFFFT